jgi:hypothetical protein
LDVGRGVPLSIKAAFAQNPAWKDAKIGQVMRSLHDDGLTVNVEHVRCFKVRVQNYKNRERAKWHVRVSKQSCKQANRLILWGVGGAPPKKNSRFFYFFFPKKT